MTEYEGRYEGNGEDLDNYGSSPQPLGHNHGGADDYSDSTSQVSVYISYIYHCPNTTLNLINFCMWIDETVSERMTTRSLIAIVRFSTNFRCKLVGCFDAAWKFMLAFVTVGFLMNIGSVLISVRNNRLLLHENLVIIASIAGYAVLKRTICVWSFGCHICECDTNSGFT